ncbi:MAG TPA: HAD hydrolase family protein [Candidatus Dormibacteraeota bacterium]|nr:HAD hydrolase family protein [Candidatus Dormibacteraeota bacterium]
MIAGPDPELLDSPEPVLPIRLLALDIDGTLVGDGMVLGERTLAGIRAAVRMGVAVSLATGRMASSARLFADPLGLRDPIVAYQGALIRAMPVPGAVGRRGRAPLGRLLLHRPLAADVARDVLVWCRGRGLEPHVNHLERFIVRSDDPRADDYSTFLGARADLVDDLVTATVKPVTKVIAMGDEGRPAALLGDARAAFAGRAEVTLSHPRFIEFIAPGVSKGRAVHWLARRAGVPLGQALAVGDQWNDLEMLQAVGHGAAMPTAPAEVRLAARYMPPPVDEEGPARLIEDLVLAGPRTAAANLERWRAEGRAARLAAAAELRSNGVHGVVRGSGVGR